MVDPVIGFGIILAGSIRLASCGGQLYGQWSSCYASVHEFRWYEAGDKRKLKRRGGQRFS